ncbi:hypothetical protein CR513_10086, partial [Mucuna pruriens]
MNESMIEVILDLENIEVTIDDEDQLVVLLSSLLDSYEHFVDIMMFGKKSLTMEKVQIALASKELTTEVDTKDTNAENLTARGHLEKRISKRGKNKEKPQEENTTVVNGSESVEVLTMTTQEARKEWILDSWCSFHLTLIRTEGGSVLLRNNKSFKVIAAGTIRLKLHDGIERILDDVRSRYYFKGEKGKLEIIKGLVVTERKVKKLRIDNGLEYFSEQFKKFCDNEGIARHKIVARTSQ